MNSEKLTELALKLINDPPQFPSSEDTKLSGVPGCVILPAIDSKGNWIGKPIGRFT